jgi:hypothetical protein
MSALSVGAQRLLTTRFAHSRVVYHKEIPIPDNYETIWDFLVCTAEDDGTFLYFNFNCVSEDAHYNLNKEVKSSVLIVIPEYIYTEYMSLIPLIAESLPSRLNGTEPAPIIIHQGTEGTPAARRLLEQMSFINTGVSEISSFADLAHFFLIK